MNSGIQPASAGTAELCLPTALRAKVRYRSDEASTYLGTVHGLTVAMRTLDKYRSVGGGPRFQKFNRSALYHRDDLDAWALEKLGDTKASTSE
ncbi:MULTISPECIES: hypothetical protein [unclassified Shinella]|uniref:hypothetical protein n=1 Tax=unclassified Shinella TaxID=2643062 RepID=UPI00225CD0CB|nr:MULTISPECIES: hypothetical protein [unclassified Shinella]MCO5139281.1 hypothetical protein [Shinella sp.]MDC7255990.1 hypothetical protein [Shinella sp. YE25]CAI0338826.1 conserved hypothetical protein [Rhizobiaceae bacterium]CAK7257256.1 DNA-binding protein [Shinella sp. WSC3-e]